MRFIHLSDLHLGKQMNDLSLLADQEAILEQILSITEEEKADAVLIAGDVYQRATPQAEAMALFDRFVSRLAEASKKVFVVSGNHDSALRISYFASLLKTAGVYVSESFDGRLQQVELRDKDGELSVWLLPFVRPAQVKRFLPGEKINSYQDAVAAVIRNTRIDPARRNVLLAHQFITGSVTSDSEEHMAGGLDQIDAAVFDGFDYVALGHIHRAQRVGRETLRYAGSPLKYSFSEANHSKSVTVVDMEEKGSVQVRKIPLYPVRDVRLIEGKLEELMQLPYSEDYVWITLRDELVPPDARVTLSVNFPNMLKFSIVNSRTRQDITVLATEAMENKSAGELFCDFYRLQNNDQLPTQAHRKVLDKVIRELEEAPYEAR
ncbi:MAG: exonuclease SbcCD subunit D [Clostridiales bacterium]|nr:exonuclease SbcCD subunit D [Clostridiales bacterium]